MIRKLLSTLFALGLALVVNLIGLYFLATLAVSEMAQPKEPPGPELPPIEIRTIETEARELEPAEVMETVVDQPPQSNVTTTPKSPSPPTIRAPRLPSSIVTHGVGEPGLSFESIASTPVGALESEPVEDVNVIMDEEAVDEPPHVVRSVMPEYPRRAEERGIEGHVLVKLLIDREGRVERAFVIESQPAGVFDEAAVSALRRFRFSPAIYRGKPVRVWARQRIAFELE